MEKKRLFLIFFFIILIGGASAQQTTLGNFKLGEDIPLIQLCSNCTFNNITSIIIPNGSTILSQAPMTRDGTQYNYNLPSTNATLFGEYRVNGFGDLDGTETVWSYSFFITPNGEDIKGDNFLIFVYVAFMIILCASIYLLIINIAKLASKSETIFGLALSWGVYFSLILMYWIINNYSTSSFLRENIIWVVSSFGFTNFLLPLISLFIAIFVRSMEKKNPLSVAELTGRRFLGYE